MNSASLPLVSLAPALLVAGCVSLAEEECRFTAPREAAVALDGARSVRVEAGAGSLDVQGQPGLGEVRATGTACSSRQRDLEQIEIRTSRRGDEILIEALIPAAVVFGRAPQRRLDLSVELPDDLALEVEDGSGAVTVRNVASLELVDGSGGLRVEDVTGDVEIEDSSGEIDVARVGGDLRLVDGSGEIEIADVSGSVRIEDGSGGIDVRRVGRDVVVEEDGSGEIEIADVGGSVLVHDDGSGSIDVRDVAGDFTVERDGSGGIRHERIGGRVTLPAER